MSSDMAVSSATRCVFWLTICTCVLVCTSSPTRRQNTETTSSEPAVTKDGWEDTDDFDLDGDEDWFGDTAASPSSIPHRQDYEDYDDDYAARRPVNIDLGNQDDDTVEHMDGEEDDEMTDNGHDADFLFAPPKDNRLMLEEDDDDQSSPIKVRHTGKNTYSEFMDDDNSVVVSKDKDDNDNQFEFTLDNNDEEDDDKEGNDNDHSKDDAVMEDSQQKLNSRQSRRDVQDDDDDDFDPDEDLEDDPVFENPEEDSQVIYGDHVFLY